MRYPGKGKTVQMISKLVTYATIVFGGTISGSPGGNPWRPRPHRHVTEEVGILGACIGACLAILSAAGSPLRRTRRGSKTASSSGPWKPASPGSPAPPIVECSTIDNNSASLFLIAMPQTPGDIRFP